MSDSLASSIAIVAVPGNVATSIYRCLSSVSVSSSVPPEKAAGLDTPSMPVMVS